MIRQNLHLFKVSNPNLNQLPMKMRGRKQVGISTVSFLFAFISNAGSKEHNLSACNQSGLRQTVFIAAWRFLPL